MEYNKRVESDSLRRRFAPPPLSPLTRSVERQLTVLLQSYPEYLECRKLADHCQCPKLIASGRFVLLKAGRFT
jgi:hypothetical protein